MGLPDFPWPPAELSALAEPVLGLVSGILGVVLSGIFFALGFSWQDLLGNRPFREGFRSLSGWVAQSGWKGKSLWMAVPLCSGAACALLGPRALPLAAVLGFLSGFDLRSHAIPFWGLLVGLPAVLWVGPVDSVGSQMIGWLSGWGLAVGAAFPLLRSLLGGGGEGDIPVYAAAGYTIGPMAVMACWFAVYFGGALWCWLQARSSSSSSSGLGPGGAESGGDSGGTVLVIPQLPALTCLWSLSLVAYALRPADPVLGF